MGGGFNGPLQEPGGGRWLIGQQQKKSSDYSTLKTCYQGRLSSVKKSPQIRHGKNGQVQDSCHHPYAQPDIALIQTTLQKNT
jgi:hypothetical protein